MVQEKDALSTTTPLASDAPLAHRKVHVHDHNQHQVAFSEPVSHGRPGAAQDRGMVKAEMERNDYW